MNDPIVNEIRMFRDEHAKQFNYNIEAICEDYKQKHGIYIEKLEKLKRIDRLCPKNILDREMGQYQFGNDTMTIVGVSVGERK